MPELEDKLQQDFRFVETEDQKQAIRQVLADMEADFPMDRLICGDVSFGKTEVALRAALRAVANGKQVAFLCPTTILALQHYRNFERRLAAFPLRWPCCRAWSAPAEKKRVVAGLKSGAVDLVVGTHSLLAKGVEFKNLGLFIVDEEQRFGVFQKEKLKKGRENVDVLTLSATPIPRTLSMALSGLQDISLIQSPPLGRLAIKNFVGLFSRQVGGLGRAQRGRARRRRVRRLQQHRAHLRISATSWPPGCPTWPSPSSTPRCRRRPSRRT